jgi:dipeptidyl-peptidase-4
LGKLELEDQVDGAKYLSGLKFVDKKRIGIWGWSYGGYMSSLGILLGNEYFKTAIAVAPVTHWRFYDTIYTERYLQKPSDNLSGYENFSPINHAEKLKGSFLLVHGTGDDNVHIQHSIFLQDALVRENKQFSLFYYPNRDHGIYGGNTRKHLYTMLTDFILMTL